MQFGFSSDAHLGTPVTKDLEVMSPAAQKVFESFPMKLLETTMQMPDVAMNEKLSLFRKSPLMLQGMKLTRPPNGGFTKTGPMHVLVGSEPAGMTTNIRQFPTYFEGDSVRGMVTSEKTGPTVTEDNLPYREADSKLKSSRGSMSLARTTAEHATTPAKRQAFYSSSSQQPVGSFPTTTPTTQTQVQPQLSQTSISPQTQATLEAPPRKKRPSILASIENTHRYVVAYMQSNKGWAALIVLAAVVLILMIVLIVKSVEASKCKQAAKFSLYQRM